MDVRKQIGVVLANEGWVSDHPADRGGMTVAGITRPSWVEFCRDTGWLREREPVRLTLDEVVQFYRWWWSRPELGLARLEDWRVQLFTFDTSVLFGRGRAAVWLQAGAAAAGAAGLVVDGKVGPKTAAAVNGLPGERVVLEMHALRVARHRDQVEKRPDQGVFLKGWLNRAERMRDLCMGER
jgi:lysozyme family protein